MPHISNHSENRFPLLNQKALISKYDFGLALNLQVGLLQCQTWGLLLIILSAGTCGAHDLSLAKRGSYFQSFLQRGTIFMTSCLLSPKQKPLRNGVNSLRIRDFVLEEQILSYKTRQLLSRLHCQLN